MPTIDSAVFGSMAVSDDCIFNMPSGLYGFEDITQYALITKKDDGATLMWYQAINSQVPCFVVFDPFEIISGFEPEMEKVDLKSLEAENIDELTFLVLAVVPEDISKTTVNLKSPLALNLERRIAKQVILRNDYPVRFPLLDTQ